jgi:sulfofructose kinase
MRTGIGGMKTILVVGVAVVDFIFQLDRMPSRAEKYRAKDAAVSGGGCAANAAVAVTRLGGSARLASRLGDDQVGEMIMDGLERERVDTQAVRRFPGKRSPFASVYVGPDGERQIVSFRDWTIPADADWIAQLDTDGVDAVLADTRWGEGAEAAMRLAREHGLPGILDGEPPFDSCGRAIEMASHVAFSALGLKTFTGEDDLSRALRVAADRREGFTCVTDGANGVRWRAGKEYGHAPAVPVKAVDTLGAGDIWHGAFALRLAEGATHEQAIGFASAYAALKCSRFGGRTTYPSRGETERLLAGASVDDALN